MTVNFVSSEKDDKYLHRVNRQNGTISQHIRDKQHSKNKRTQARQKNINDRG